MGATRSRDVWTRRRGSSESRDMSLSFRMFHNGRDTRPPSTLSLCPSNCGARAPCAMACLPRSREPVPKVCVRRAVRLSHGDMGLVCSVPSLPLAQRRTARAMADRRPGSLPLLARSVSRSRLPRRSSPDSATRDERERRRTHATDDGDWRPKGLNHGLKFTLKSLNDRTKCKRSLFTHHTTRKGKLC